MNNKYNRFIFKVCCRHWSIWRHVIALARTIYRILFSSTKSVISPETMHVTSKFMHMNGDFSQGVCTPGDT